MSLQTNQREQQPQQEPPPQPPHHQDQGERRKQQAHQDYHDSGLSDFARQLYTLEKHHADCKGKSKAEATRTAAENYVHHHGFPTVHILGAANDHELRGKNDEGHLVKIKHQSGKGKYEKLAAASVEHEGDKRSTSERASGGKKKEEGQQHKSPSDEQKYAGEASHVASLLYHRDYKGAQRALSADGALKPHELHKFMAELKSAYGTAGKGSPDVTITDDKSGVKVTEKEESGDQAKTLFERSGEELSKAKDKIPMTGELLHLTPEQTKAILDKQQEEKQANGGKSHLFGDIAVSLGYASPDQVNKALSEQDRARAEQTAGDLMRTMPVQAGEGYRQLVERTHPEMGAEEAKEYASNLKRYNKDRDDLNVGEQLRTSSPESEESERKALAERFYKEYRKKTGNVKAKYLGQPLDEIPID